MDYLAEVHGLCKSYPAFQLRDVDLNVPAGSIVGLIGENGAGKTTTLKAMLNVIHPDAGEIRLMGDAVSAQTLSEVAVVWEDSYFDGSFSPRQVSSIMAGLVPHWDPTQFTANCERFELPAQQPIKGFSRGMRMKLSLATALARHPRLLLLDEATSGLDPVVRGEMLELFLDFIQDETRGILLSSHITSDLEKIADQIAYIHKGQLLFQTNKEELLESMAIVRCSAADLNTLPAELLVAQQQNAFGSAALVRQPALVKRQLPHAVFDRAGLDDIMQFMAGRKAQ